MKHFALSFSVVFFLAACTVSAEDPVTTGASAQALTTCTALTSTDCQNGTGPHASSSMAGDVSGVVKTFTGTDNEFITLAVMESVIGYVPLEAHLSLSGSGSDYDLYVYDAALQATRNCTSVTWSSTNVGSDHLDLVWNDNTSNDYYTSPFFPVMVGDSRRITIEVRSKTSTCGSWTLTAAGKP
jgi:hypothetical protein